MGVKQETTEIVGVYLETTEIVGVKQETTDIVGVYLETTEIVGVYLELRNRKSCVYCCYLGIEICFVFVSHLRHVSLEFGPAEESRTVPVRY